MRSGRSHTAFSLFSFQDIITSVTAILILVMLLLTLEMVTRRRQQAATDPAETRRHLDGIVANLEALAGLLRDDAAAATQSKIDRRPREQLEADVRRLENNLSEAQLRLAETKRIAHAVAEQRRKAEATQEELVTRRDLVATLEGQRAKDRRQADLLEEKNSRERDSRSRRPAAGRALVYNVSPDAGRRQWLVELSRDGVVAWPIDGSGREDLGATTDEGSLLVDWIDRLDPTGDQCYLLLRPSCARLLVAQIMQRLEARGVAYGMDILGENQTVRVGSTIVDGRAGEGEESP
jgi:hypothetical protein